MRALLNVVVSTLAAVMLVTLARAAEQPPPRIEGPRIINANPSAPGVPNETSAPPVEKPNAIVQQPRPFGYVIGDIFTQRVLLALDGKQFVPAELPTPGRAGIWFERRAIRTEKDSGGRLWLVIDYQLMNAPQSVAVATLPAWKVNSRPAGSELRVAAWPMSVGPLTPEKPLARAGLGALQPDHAAIPVDLSTLERLFKAALALLIVTAAGWLGWWAWRNWRASASQPFAVALREMRNVGDGAPEAWFALHRAFDSTAGKSLRAASIASWLDRTPRFQPLRSTIEQFFAQSETRFFAGDTPSNAVAVRALCRDLRRIEKRHES